MVLIKCTIDKKRESHFIGSIKIKRGEREIP